MIDMVERLQNIDWDESVAETIEDAIGELERKDAEIDLLRKKLKAAEAYCDELATKLDALKPVPEVNPE